MGIMSLRLNPELQKFIDDQIRDDHCDSPEEVVEAGLATFQQQTRSEAFAPGELDQLLTEGEGDVMHGRLHDGEEVFREIDELSAARRRATSE
jgi:Arc/MetJ-type ribon-helix-helix transcriptional regulator